ncbi:NfeD family protein [Alteromonas facilis]|uniref:NfeD family protein n=1 Tax=Alteromonas facilis TaxID=2048004 RepID=UPI000C289426|nr:NfeD family protein [Alteromonas facilis]
MFGLTEDLVFACFIAGVLLIGLEWLIYRFNSLVCFSFGLGFVSAGGFAYFQVIPLGWASMLACMFVTTVFFLVAFRPSFKNLRSNLDGTRSARDLIGYRFLLVNDVSSAQKSVHHYSGRAWRLRSKDSIKAGTWVEVIRADLGEFTIRPRYDR